MRLSVLKNKPEQKIVIRVLVLLVAMSLIAYGIWGFWQRQQVTNNPNPVIPTDIVTNSTQIPDETKPYCDDSYTVPRDTPRKIEISSIGVDGCIQRVGIDQHKAIAVPSNIHLAGWYTGSVLPGKKGLSIIDGHVLGRYNDAIFAQLKDLKKSDTIRIQLGDKSWREFSITSVDTYSVDKTMSEVYKPYEGDSRLVLITCDGVYDPNNNSYDKRVVVRTKLIE